MSYTFFCFLKSFLLLYGYMKFLGTKYIGWGFHTVLLKYI